MSHFDLEKRLAAQARAREMLKDSKFAAHLPTTMTGEADAFPLDRPKPELRVVPGEKIGRAVATASALKTAKASEYVMRGITWFWPNRFSIGKLALIGGLPDKGKGLIGSYLSACTTNKLPLPCNEGEAPQGSVLLFTAEDDPEDTVVPRLAAAGADLDRVHIVKVIGEPN